MGEGTVWSNTAKKILEDNEWYMTHTSLPHAAYDWWRQYPIYTYNYNTEDLVVTTSAPGRVTKLNENNIMKYYKVIKYTPEFNKGAVLRLYQSKQYVLVDGYDVFYKIEPEDGGTYYISKEVVENSEEYYTRVYRTKVGEDIRYVSKEEAQKNLTN